MIHFTRIILVLSIVVFAVNNVIVDAGKGEKYRKKNLSQRASKHENIIKSHGDQIVSKYGEMSDSVIEELTKLSYIVIDQIVDHENFKMYLKHVFKTLREYAEGQIKARYESLENIYKRWEKKNFPDKELKEKIRSTLIEEGKINVDTKSNQEKRSKKK